MIGVAGGISPYNQIEVIVPLAQDFANLSFDTEGSIRDKKTDELLFTETTKLLGNFHSNVINPIIKPIICDGCNVNEPFEHRCHGEGRIMVRGDVIDGACECTTCVSPETDENYLAWVAAGMPKEWF